MNLVVLFSVTLVMAILFSAKAERSVLSTSVFFLLVGAVFGRESLGLLSLDAGDPVVSIFAKLALFTVLFTDGMKLSAAELWREMNRPARALLLGLPLTILGTAALAHWLGGLPWLESILLGGILSPTDPVLVSAIVGREEVPTAVRRLLHIESGFNDGLALPVVVVVLHFLSGEKAGVLSLVLEIAAGVVLGFIIPWAILRIESMRIFEASESYRQFMPTAAAMLVFSICGLTDANEYIAAFVAGITIATLGPDLADEFESFGEPLSELLKLGALMVFGALISVTFLREIPLGGYIFAALTLLAVRPLALGISFVGDGLPRHQFATAAWFGPKGFASVTYALMVVQADVSNADVLFHLAALVTAASIVIHSSIDVPVAEWLARREAREPLENTT